MRYMPGPGTGHRTVFYGPNYGVLRCGFHRRSPADRLLEIEGILEAFSFSEG